MYRTVEDKTESEPLSSPMTLCQHGECLWNPPVFLPKSCDIQAGKDSLWAQGKWHGGRKQSACGGRLSQFPGKRLTLLKRVCCAVLNLTQICGIASYQDTQHFEIKEGKRRKDHVILYWDSSCCITKTITFWDCIKKRRKKKPTPECDLHTEQRWLWPSSSGVLRLWIQENLLGGSEMLS